MVDIWTEELDINPLEVEKVEEADVPKVLREEKEKIWDGLKEYGGAGTLNLS